MLSKNKLWFGLKVKNAQTKSSNLGYLNFQFFCILSFKFENTIKNPELCFFYCKWCLNKPNLYPSPPFEIKNQS